jgi:LacI family transcriptional regulator
MDDIDWRSPKIGDIAREARVGTATVDRVLNGRSSVREATKQKVLAAILRLKKGTAAATKQAAKKLAFIVESGTSYNQTLEAAVTQYAQRHGDVSCSFTAIASSQVDPIKFANLIERTAEQTDGLIIVAREHLMITRAVRNVVARKVPVVCLTTDLPASGRQAYIGSDQASAGSAAAYLMGQILLVYSASYRAQEERELGFRRVLRSDFAQLKIDDRVNSSDNSEHAYRNVMAYIESHGTPIGIYNTVGGNIGIGKALNELGLVGKVIFIGHELNPNSRQLLEGGIMNFAIGHDVLSEVETAANYVLDLLDNKTPPPASLSSVRIYTKFNCN